MKEHFSVAGTTCWFCGHPAGDGNKARKMLGDVAYLACRDCHHAPRGEETSRRDADVEGIKQVLAGGIHVPGYFTKGSFNARVAEFQGYDLHFIDSLKAKEYSDPFAKLTQGRLEAQGVEYRKAYREERKEQIYRQYHEGGGRERAAAIYQARKVSLPPKVQKILPPEELEVKRLRANEYAKEWYQRKKAAQAVMIVTSTEFNQQGDGI